VYCALDDADLQTEYIKVLTTDGKSAALTAKYGEDDRVYA
jgi:hypothetical protein